MTTAINKISEVYFPETSFGGFSRINGTVAFYTRISALVEPENTILDIGCGRGRWYTSPTRFVQNFKGRCSKVIGIDHDPAGRENPSLDEFRIIEHERWPVESNSIDVAYADHVLEHVAEPARFFAEAARVIRVGGYLCLRTPNAHSYVGILTRLIPDNKHHRVLKFAMRDAPEERDVFPTLYRCNSRPKIKRALEQAGFQGVVYGYEGDPVYLSRNRVLYRIGLLHARYAPSAIKQSLVAFSRRV